MFDSMATAAPQVDADELEELRREIGVSKTTLTELLEKHSPEELRAAHAEFVEHTKAAIAYEFKTPAFNFGGHKYLSAIQAARALGTGEFHLSNLRDRGKLHGTPHGRRVVYSKLDLTSLLKPSKTDKHRSPLAASFTRWLELRK